MGERTTRANEDTFLGSLLGLAIGDALGRPVAGLTTQVIQDRFGEIRAYVPAEDDAENIEDDAGTPGGQITDETEIVLSIVESLTTNDGMLDSANIHARLTYLAHGASRRWMPDSVAEGILRAGDSGGLVPEKPSSIPDLSVAVRGVPIGLLHSIGAYDQSIVRDECEIVSRLSHAGEAQYALTREVAEAVGAAARGGKANPERERADGNNDASALFAMAGHAITAAFQAAQFEDAVQSVVEQGGPADTTGAISGAIAGARFGASGIPQELIDGLDARIYLSLAAPWFYRTALRRAGTVIDLRLIE